MVDVVGVMVAAPVPMSHERNGKLLAKLVVPACGRVTAIAEAFEKLT